MTPEAPTAPAELDETNAKWLDVYNLVSAKISELEEVKKRARDHLVQFADDHGAEALLRDGQPAATVRFKSTTRLDTAKMKASEPEVYERYAVRGVTKELRVK
jgi:predicted phage-related endonuclease